MKKCLIGLCMMIALIMPIYNVNAQDKSFSYKYSSSILGFDYNDLGNYYYIYSGSRSYYYSIDKPYYLVYWQGWYLVFLSSDSPITLTSYNSSFYKAISNSDIYMTSYSFNGGSVNLLYENVIYELGKYKFNSEDLGLPNKGVKSWNQFLSNYDVYLSDNTLYSNQSIFDDLSNDLTFSMSVVGKDNVTYNIPDDEYDNYIIGYFQGDYSNWNGYKLRLLKFSSDEVNYIARTAISNISSSDYTTYVSTYKQVVCKNDSRCTTDGTGANREVNFKIYDYINGTFVLSYSSIQSGIVRSLHQMSEILYSTNDIYLRYDQCESVNGMSYFEGSGKNQNFITYGSTCSNFSAPSGYDSAFNNLTYSHNVSSYIDFDYEYITLNGVKTAVIDIFTNSFNSDYKYKLKFYNDSFETNFIDISKFLSSPYSGVYNYNLTYKSIMILAVYDENDVLIDSKTFEFADLPDYDSYTVPKMYINVDYLKNNFGFDYGKVTFNISTFNSLYKYQYSLDGLYYRDISYSDLYNNKFSIDIYETSYIYSRIVDLDGNIISSSYDVVDIKLNDDDLFYYYYLTIDDLYDSDKNQFKYYSFYFNNNKDTLKNDYVKYPFISFNYYGSNYSDIGLFIHNNVIDLKSTILALNDSPFIPTSLPYYFYKDNSFPQNFTSYTLLSFTLANDNFVYSDYSDFQLIIKSNTPLNIGDSVYVDGVLIPSTGNVSSNRFKNFFNQFINAFNHFKNVISDILKNISMFFENISPDLQFYFIVIFVLSLFGVLIKFLL